MYRPVVVCLLLLLPACRGPQEFSAPAPAGALDCARREAEDMGYRAMEGSREEGYLRMSQQAEPPREAEREARDPLPGPNDVRPIPRDQPRYNELMLRQDGERLRIQLVGRLKGGEVVEAGRTAEGDAQRILAACSTD